MHDSHKLSSRFEISGSAGTVELFFLLIARMVVHMIGLYLKAGVSLKF